MNLIVIKINLNKDIYIENLCCQCSHCCYANNYFYSESFFSSKKGHLLTFFHFHSFRPYYTIIPYYIIFIPYYWKYFSQCLKNTKNKWQKFVHLCRNPKSINSFFHWNIFNFFDIKWIYSCSQKIQTSCQACFIKQLGGHLWK